MNGLPTGPGRPRKYGTPSRAVTVTLPEDVLARLSSINVDVGHAIVALAHKATKRNGHALRRAELAAFGRHAVIVVKPAKALRNIVGVQLVPIGDGRALIALDAGRSIPQLELELRDTLERKDLDGDERQTLEAISDILREARRSRGVVVEPRTIIVIESKRKRRR